MRPSASASTSPACGCCRSAAPSSTASQPNACGRRWAASSSKSSAWPRACSTTPAWMTPEEEIVATQGRPCSPDDEIRIVDGEARDVRPGEAGELLARGPYTIRGYYNVPARSQRAITPDGYYRTGDIVRLGRRQPDRRGTGQGPDQPRW